MEFQKEKVYNKVIYPIPSKEDFIEFVGNQKKILIAINARKVITKDPEYTRIINENIAYPDGKSPVMGLAKKGVKSIKYPGYILWLDIVRRYYKKKSFYLIGAKQVIVENTVSKLRQEFPGIKILNFRNGYISDEEIPLLKEDIKDKRPDIVFVAMGSPKQEFLMDQLIKEYPALYAGLGGSFDVYSGEVKKVPDWWEKFYLPEGLYRVLSDRKKIKRQKNMFVFLFYYFLNKI